MNTLKADTPVEEVASSLTHGLGAVLSIVGLFALIWRDETPLPALHVTSYTVFGGSMVVLYLASTLYHAFFRNKRLYRIFQLIDHSAIYVLIAGTYTPFTLITIKGSSGIWMFVIIWLMAISGVIFKFFFIGKYKRLSLLFYLIMGWVGAFFYRDLLNELKEDGFNLLLLGGLSYSIGVVFYIWNKLPFNHAIWHLFVMGGSAFLYFCIYHYVR
ncbi:hemolysin III family protein [Limibacter armeniacum]|uniref:PAQR family membrane homeostasis protein TrhA n=1 Tax=Limibacter armeniacum TaxID=466084 RepID=UPI002FE50282